MLRTSAGYLSITGTHAPHAALGQSDGKEQNPMKDKYYDRLEEFSKTFAKHNMHYIIGDVNAKIVDA